MAKHGEELDDWEAGTSPEGRETSVVEWVMSLPRRRSSSLSVISHQTGISWSSRTDSFVGELGSSSSLEASRKFEKLISRGTISVLAEESLKSRPGWPLLRIKAPGTMDSSSEEEDSSAFFSEEPSSSPRSEIGLILKKAQIPATEDAGLEGDATELVLDLKSSSSCKFFTYEMLSEATNHFSSENLIGEGGCSIVYKGRLANGRLVAVKVLKQYKEAWVDFSLEVEIMASVNHKYITPLVGACSEQHRLMLVYDFMSEGSLEEQLEDHGKDKARLPWQARFKVAVAVAEALHYLHGERSRPIIHRDVKSSNILISGQFQPQLSDFGLAMWGPPQTDYDATQPDVVGTFGYIAPEYIMHGRVSEKTDVYSYGVVLLELLTGRKAISSKGQESLVKWARPFLDKGNFNSLLDPKLNGEVNMAEVQRTILAAVLCTKQSPRLRPNARQILELLGEEDVRHWVSSYVNGVIQSDKLEDGSPDIYPCKKPYQDIPFLKLDDEQRLVPVAKSRLK